MLFRPNPSLGLPIYLQLMEHVKHAVERVRASRWSVHGNRRRLRADVEGYTGTEGHRTGASEVRGTGSAKGLYNVRSAGIIADRAAQRVELRITRARRRGQNGQVHKP